MAFPLLALGAGLLLGKKLFPKALVPKGSGYAQGATQQQQQAITDAQTYLKPTKDLFAGYLSGNKTMGDMPSFMQTPDWRTTQNDVYGAMTPLADINARDLFEKNNAILQKDRLKSGNIYGSAGTATSLPDLMTFVEMQKAKDRAEALTKSLDVGAMLRGEAGTNWWNMLKTVGDTGNAAALSNVAQNYSQIGANQTNFIGNLLKLGADAAAMGAM